MEIPRYDRDESTKPLSDQREVVAPASRRYRTKTLARDRVEITVDKTLKINDQRKSGSGSPKSS
jgi:hypothetical protein